MVTKKGLEDFQNGNWKKLLKKGRVSEIFHEISFHLGSNLVATLAGLQVDDFPHVAGSG